MHALGNSSFFIIKPGYTSAILVAKQRANIAEKLLPSSRCPFGYCVPLSSLKLFIGKSYRVPFTSRAPFLTGFRDLVWFDQGPVANLRSWGLDGIKEHRYINATGIRKRKKTWLTGIWILKAEELTKTRFHGICSCCKYIWSRTR